MATKVIKKMETKQTDKKIAKHGFISELAKMCGCSRLTVSTALYHNAKGKKADKVRYVFKKFYIVISNKKCNFFIYLKIKKYDINDGLLKWEITLYQKVILILTSKKYR